MPPIRDGILVSMTSCWPPLDGILHKPRTIDELLGILKLARNLPDGPSWQKTNMPLA